MTTGSSSKGNTSFYKLVKHISSLPVSTRDRITIIPYTMDLTNLVSVSRVAKFLAKNYSRIDFLFLNASMAEFGGVDWVRFAKSFFKFWDWVAHRTYPTFKTQTIGCTSTQYIPAGLTEDIGTVFCANVLGHYYLVHELMGSLVVGRGRIIWTSSLESNPWSFTLNDIQGVETAHSYESSMRLIDILSLTADAHYTAPYTSRWLAHPAALDAQVELDPLIIKKPKAYLAHPGICATSVFLRSVTDSFILFYLMILGFKLASWFGSSWHTVSTYAGAKSAVWIALAGDEELETVDASHVKWGSAMDRDSGDVLCKSTDVEGRGGSEWECLAFDCWREMESLRSGLSEKFGGEGSSYD